jgi:hypothetical protein
MARKKQRELAMPALIQAQENVKQWLTNASRSELLRLIQYVTENGDKAAYDARYYIEHVAGVPTQFSSLNDD